MGFRSPKRKGRFWGLSGPFKSIGSLAAVYVETAEVIEMPFRRLTRWAQVTTIRWAQDHPQKGAILGGCPTHSKALAVSAAVFAAKWIIPSSIITARSEWDIAQSSITTRHAMRPFDKTLLTTIRSSRIQTSNVR